MRGVTWSMSAFDVSAYYLATRFQNVIELQVREGQLHESDSFAR
jgi:hypothetical protein